jgi:DNA-binding MarR family transcriptional regulator/GNAT superfamily N-acetyltransferase
VKREKPRAPVAPGQRPKGERADARATELTARVDAIRRFNRFYTKQIGVLQEGHLQSRFGLAEVRVLYELAHRDAPTAREIAADLELDAGYLSRILQRFKRERLVTQQASSADRRQRLLMLTKRGRHTFDELDSRAADAIRQMLSRHSVEHQVRVVRAAHTLESLLGIRSGESAPLLLRPHQPGDLGWIVHRHGVVYADEFGWNEEFEALVAKIASEFLEGFDSRRERCWIAEKDGERVGSVLLVKKSREVAQLRLLFVEPGARRLGLGTRLVSECTRFARQAGYRRITLWTQRVLTSARRLYEREGYRLVAEEPHHSFGVDLVGQTWEKDLRGES